MGKAKTIFSGMAWSTIQNIVNILYGLIAVPFLINFYGKEEYGLIGLAMSVNAYVTLLDMGMTNSNVRFFSEYLAKRDNERTQRLFGLTHLFYLVLGVVNTILLFGASLFVETFFKVTPDQAVILRHLLWILALNATFSWISVCFDQFLRANELIDWIKRRATFLKLMLFVVLFSAIVFKWPIEWYFFCYTFVGTIILPWTIIKARRVMPSLRFKYKYDGEMLHTILPYALSIFSFAIFHFFVTSSRPLFLGNMVGPGAVAEFNIMIAITSVVTVFTTSVMQVLLPILTKMQVQQDEQGVQSMMLTGTKFLSIFLSGLIFFLAISSNELLTLYVGDEYTSLSDWLIIWLLTLLLSHRNVMTALVFTEKRLISIAIMCAVAMVVALTLYTLLVPRFGVGGVVIGFSVHELIHTLFYYIYFLPRRFSINTRKIFLEAVLPTWLLVGGAAVIICFLIDGFHSLWIALAVKSGILGLVSLPLIWFLILRKKDKIVLKSIMNN